MSLAAAPSGKANVFARALPNQIVVGLIGAGIQASRSPAMHEAEGRAHGLRYAYRLIDLEILGLEAGALPELLTQAQQAGYAGLNITHPCKQAVLPLLDRLSDNARALSAVNTVVFEAGQRIGHNTDWWGFAHGFRRGLADASMRRVVQFGAGGAGSAVAYALLTLGADQVVLVDVDPAKAAKLAQNLAAQFGPGRAVASTDVAGAVASANGIVNATPMGMAKYPGLPLPAELLRPELWVVDIVYFPLETALLRAARSIGCRTLDGSGMAVFQAVEAFRLFTGRTPVPERMAATFASLEAVSP